MLKLAIVVNEPPPYRIPVFNLIARHPQVRLQVIFCCRREPNRLWDLPPVTFDHVFLRERISTVQGRYIHNNPDVLLALSRSGRMWFWEMALILRTFMHLLGLG